MRLSSRYFCVVLNYIRNLSHSRPGHQLQQGGHISLSHTIDDPVHYEPRWTYGEPRSLVHQGLPIHELLLTRETEDQLADLAGNAMSTTVVGASIFAALVAGMKLLTAGDDVESNYYFKDLHTLSVM